MVVEIFFKCINFTSEKRKLIINDSAKLYQKENLYSFINVGCLSKHKVPTYNISLRMFIQQDNITTSFCPWPHVKS